MAENMQVPPADGQAPPAAVPATEVPRAAPEPPPPASASPSIPSSASPASAPSAPSAPAQPSWLENLRTSGYDLGQDERAALDRLQGYLRENQQLQSIRHLVPHVNTYLQHAPQFNQWIQEQSQARDQQKQEQEKAAYWSSYWKPPEYNPAWQQQVVQDDKGNLMPAPGAPPDVVGKIQAYTQFRREQAEAFMSNPHQYIEPTVRALAKEEAERLIGQQMREMRDQQMSQQFMAQNASWIYDTDPQTGQPRQFQAINPHTGQMESFKSLSPWGNLLQQKVQEVAAAQQTRGYQDIEEQKNLAWQQTQLQYALWENQQLKQQAAQPTIAPAAAPATTPQQVANDRFLRDKNPTGKRGGNSVPAQVKPPKKENLAQVMMENLRAAGFSEDSFRK